MIIARTTPRSTTTLGSNVTLNIIKPTSSSIKSTSRARSIPSSQYHTTITTKLKTVVTASKVSSNSSLLTRTTIPARYYSLHHKPAVEPPEVPKEQGETLTSWRLDHQPYIKDLHRFPILLSDRVAYYCVKALRIPADLFFSKRYGNRAIVLETVAAIPGMVAGVVRHLRSLRIMNSDGGWIPELLDEAENERMHLLTFLQIQKPSFWERMLVMVTQGVFFNIYFFFYMFFPRTAHRFVGYLEEEAIVSYTQYLDMIDAGKIENGPAPRIAIDYWNLPPDAKLRDVVLVVRADEARHRDVNHRFSDVLSVGNQKPDIETSVPLKE